MTPAYVYYLSGGGCANADSISVSIVPGFTTASFTLRGRTTERASGRSLLLVCKRADGG